MHSPLIWNYSTSLMVILHFFFLGVLVKASIERQVILNELTQFPCEIPNDSKPFYKLEESSSSIILPGVSIGGWILPRGYLDQYYTIFSFHESSSSQPTVYEVQYNPIQNTLMSYLLSVGDTPYKMLYFYSQRWIYVLASVYYDSTLVKLQGRLLMWASDLDQFFDRSMTSTTSHLYGFDSSTIELNIGYSSIDYPSSIPSCSYASYVSVFSDGNMYNKMNSVNYDIQTHDTQLFQHLSGLYTNMTPGFILNLAPEQDAMVISDQNLNPLNFVTAVSGNQFYSVRLNMNDYMGLVIQFSILVTQSTLTTFQNIVELIELKAYVVITTSGKLAFKAPNSSNIDILLQAYPSIYQIVIIIKPGISPSILCIADTIVLGSALITQKRTVQLRFGQNPSNVQAFTLNSIRVFEGMYLYKTATCLHGIKAEGKIHCLICEPTHLISLQDYDCYDKNTSTADTSFSIEKQWSYQPHSACLVSGMQHDQATGECGCRKQYFFDGVTCKICKRYCNGCENSETNCKEIDLLRNKETGECSSGTFDDGYNCISRIQLIRKVNPSPNSMLFSNKIDYDVSPCYSPNVSEDSFLFSFSFKPVIDALLTFENPIAVFRFNSADSNISLIQYSTSSRVQIQVYIYDSSTPSLTFSIHPINTVWIAIWSNYLKTKLWVVSNGMLSQYNLTENFSSSVLSPEVCVGGGCSTFNIPQKGEGLVLSASFRFIAKVVEPQQSDEEEIMKLMLVDSVILAMFSLEIKEYSSSQIGQVQSNYNLGQILDLQTMLIGVDQVLKGFGLIYIYNQKGTISLTGYTIEFPISFSMTIFIELISSDVPLISYYYTSDIRVDVFISLKEMRQNANVRICIGTSCKFTKNAFVNIGEANFLAVFTMDRSMYSVDILSIAFKVICNYKSEIVSFIIPRPKLIDSKLNVITFVDTVEKTKDFSVYINRIFIINGNSYFYEDFDPTENCYVLLDFYDYPINMKTCIIPKKHRVLLEREAIPEATCLSSPYTIRFVNPYTRECIDSKQLKSICADINMETLQCTACQQGYYFPIGSNECQQCNSICLTCEDTSSNCLECHGTINQDPPSCECLNITYLLNTTTKLCDSCEKRCDGCSDSISQCISCSLNRQSPPDCACIEGFFENTSTGECEPFVCDNKCSTCSDDPSNCLTCKDNRGSAPECACMQGAYIDSNGDCQICGSGKYYIASINGCGYCESPCSECVDYSTKCLSCDSGLRLVVNACLCGSNYISITRDNGELACAKQVTIQFAILSKGNANLVIEIQFPFKVKEIDFNEYKPSDLLQLSLADVSSDMFTLSNPSVSEDKFSVEVVPNKAFTATSGSLIFLVTRPFVNESEEEILNSSFLSEPLSISPIGPLFLTDISSSDLNLNGVSSGIKNYSPGTFYVFQNFQLIFYLFKQLEPSIYFLLLKLQFPPNLYAFLQTLGMMVYPDVLDYQVTTPSTKSSPMFDFDDEQGSLALNKSQDFVYKRLGFSNSLLITMPMVCLKYFIFFAAVVVLNTLSMALLSRQELFDSLVEKIKLQIIGDTEVNLIISMLSIYLNVDNLNEDNWASRSGFYCSIIVIGVNAYAMSNLYFDVYVKPNAQAQKQKFMKVVEFEKYQEEQKMLKTKEFSFYVTFLKCFIVTVLYLCQDFSKVACILCSCTFLVSIVLTIKLEPFLLKRSRLVKIVTDFLFFTSWILVLVIESKESEMGSSIDDDLNASYQSVGQYLVYVLIVANLIFVVEQIFSTVDAVKLFLENRRKSKKAEEEKKMLEEEKTFL